VFDEENIEHGREAHQKPETVDNDYERIAFATDGLGIIIVANSY
jgi:hypothetical protein